MKRIALTATLLLSTVAHSQSQFGSAGSDGRTGAPGRNGRNGQALVVRAEGQTASYDVQGTDGGNGVTGEPGYGANGCFQPTPDYDLFGAAGGDGGRGGDGGVGGDGGSVTVYYTDISKLGTIFVRGTPGNGGNAAWGGRGGDGCRCQQYSWTTTRSDGTTVTHTCRDGQRGNDAGGGNLGQDGSYGRVTLIAQLDPVAAETPIKQIDMAKMMEGPFLLSKNHWEAKRGARRLFASGSDLSDSYSLFTGRTEINYGFDWRVSRPVTDFRNWWMQIQIEGNDAVLYLPNGLWVDAEKIVDGNNRTYVIKGAVSTGELGNLQFRSLGGIGENHVVAVKDNAEVSDILTTTVRLKYWTYENGNYRVRFDADVPAEALTVAKDGFEIAMGKLGLDPNYLKRDTQSYVGLTMKRALAARSASYTLGTYYTIKFLPAVGDTITVEENANLYVGNTVVGRVTAGEQYTATDIQGDWVALKKLDGTAVRGWLNVDHIATPTE